MKRIRGSARYSYYVNNSVVLKDGDVTYFKKYCKPIRRFSKNFGLNLDTKLLGGNLGIADS